LDNHKGKNRFSVILPKGMHVQYRAIQMQKRLSKAKYITMAE